MASAVPGGLGMMLGVLACVACAGGCFAKWLVEEDKYQKTEHEKYLENLKKGLTNNPIHVIIKVQKGKGTDNNVGMVEEIF